MMRHLLKPLLMVLAVPVLATVLGLQARSDWDARWRNTIVRQLAGSRMRVDQRLVARYSLESLCSTPAAARRLPACRSYDFYTAVILFSAAVGGAGFLFLGILLLAGWASRTAQRRLGWLFRPSLVFAACGVAVLAAAHALLAVAAVAVGWSYLLGQPVESVAVSLLLVVGTAAAVWTLAVAAAAFSVTRRGFVTVVGRLLDPAAQPALAAEVRRVAAAVGARAPAHMVACLPPSIFVTDARVACLDGTTAGRTLVLSLALCRILTVEEFRALLAHELAHCAEGQGAASRRRSVPSATAAVRGLQALRRQAYGIRAAAVVPAHALLSVFVDEARVLQDEAVSEQERAADACAASVAGARALGSALVKVQAFGPAWQLVEAAMFDAASSGTQYVNASALFEEVVAANRGPGRLRGLGQQSLEHPTDRHPTLAERLAVLDLAPADAAASALDTSPASPAAAMVSGGEAIEQSLSAAEHHLLAAQ